MMGSKLKFIAVVSALILMMFALVYFLIPGSCLATPSSTALLTPVVGPATPAEPRPFRGRGPEVV
jgi:hypothetical protein